jgi:branched-chain amino acid transport system substrate-binding protein
MVTEKRLTRRDFIKVAALSGAGLVAAACTPQQAATTTPAKDKIVVGLSRPLSGPLAIIGDSAFRPVYETWVAEVNAAGGIEVAELGKKLPVELLVYDDKSDLGTMTRLTEKLIVEDKVDFLWPACTTAFFFAQAPIANKYGYILFSAEAGASSLKDMLPSMPYIFAALSFSDWNQIPVLAEILAEQGAKTAYILYIADLFGIEYSGVAGIEFPKHGIEILGVKSVPPDIKDLSPLIADAKASEADVFCCLAYPDQVMPATGTSMALGYNPKAWIGGPGVNFGFYHAAFGPATEGAIGFAGWNKNQSEATKQLAEKLYTGKPEEIQDWWGHPFYWATLELWKQAIEKAGSLDQDKIREIVATQKFDTVLGSTWFENGLMAKEAHLAEIGQWQNGEYEVIGPKDKATAGIIYPKPEWPAT